MNDELEQQIAQAFNRQAAQLSVPTMTSMTEGRFAAATDGNGGGRPALLRRPPRSSP